MKIQTVSAIVPWVQRLVLTKQEGATLRAALKIAEHGEKVCMDAQWSEETMDFARLRVALEDALDHLSK